MGKTKRKCAWTDYKSKSIWIEEQARSDYQWAYVRSSTRTKKYVKYSKEEFEKHSKEVDIRNEMNYNKHVEKFGPFEKLFIYMTTLRDGKMSALDHTWSVAHAVEVIRKTCPEFIPFKKENVKYGYYVDLEDLTFEEYLDKNYDTYDKDWIKLHRDGRFAETVRRTGFKDQVKQDMRSHNKKMIHNIKENVDNWDDAVFYGGKEGKQYRWNWW